MTGVLLGEGVQPCPILGEVIREDTVKGCLCALPWTPTCGGESMVAPYGVAL